MTRNVATYILIPSLIALAGWGGYLMKGESPTQVKAETLVLVDRSAGTSIRRNPAPAPVMELPDAERERIEGQGALDSASYFNCWITNASSWTVTELRFRVAAGQPEGSTRWERNYNERVDLAPGASSRILFKVTDGRDAETRWKIIGARGVPSE